MRNRSIEDVKEAALYHMTNTLGRVASLERILTLISEMQFISEYDTRARLRSENLLSPNSKTKPKDFVYCAKTQQENLV